MKTRSWFFRLLALCAISILLALVPFARADEEITAGIVPDRDEITVGDLVRLTVQVNHPAGYRVLPLRPGQTWGEFEVRTVFPVEVTTNDDGSETSTQVIQVTLWTPGEHSTPPLTLNVSDTTGALQEIKVEPVSLVVNSVLVEGDDELRDIKPQAALPLPPVWPWVVAGIVLVIVLAFAARWLLRWRQRRRLTGEETPLSVPDLRPAYQIALDELAQIEALDLPAEGRFKEHYTLVADVLRRYLEAGHQVPAMDRTTTEIRRALKRLLLPAAHKSELVDLLADADLVKFAKVLPELGQAQHFPDRARQFVLVTQPEPVAASQNGGSGETVEMAA